MRIKTDRLIIRPFEKGDLAAFRKLLDIEELPGWGMQKGNAAGFLDWQIAQYERMDICHGTVCLGIFDKETGQVLGNVGAGEHDDLHEPEIFYALRREYRGKGYAAEAAMAVTDWALATYDIPYLIGTVDVDNIPSQRVLEKCGYQLVEEKTLLVHVLGETSRFKVYRKYRLRNGA